MKTTKLLFLSVASLLACGALTTAMYYSSYASSSANSSYACADTANGGFNETY